MSLQVQQGGEGAAQGNANPPQDVDLIQEFTNALQRSEENLALANADLALWQSVILLLSYRWKFNVMRAAAKAVAQCARSIVEVDLDAQGASRTVLESCSRHYGTLAMGSSPSVVV